jgi:nitrite reductase/ring-hydroxylating ferredoxin subunit
VTDEPTNDPPRDVEKRYVRLGRARDIPDGKGRRYAVSGMAVAVFNVRGRFFACTDRCPHMAARLSQGRLEGEIVVCWMHGWKIDLRDGSCPGRDRARVEVFPVRLSGETLEIELTDRV